MGRDAKRELHSRGSKEENKRQARNHLKKARERMNQCGGAWLQEDESEFDDADDVVEQRVEEQFEGERLKRAKRFTEEALRTTNHMLGEMELDRVTRGIDQALHELN